MQRPVLQMHNLAMRPWFEHVAVESGKSWTLFDRQLPSFPFNWHYHPEFELTLTLNSVGERFVGDNVSSYGDGDLVLVGPNLPHAWRSRASIDTNKPHRALVFWFTPQWAQGLVGPYSELDRVGELLAQARHGLEFGSETISCVRPKLLGLVDLAPAKRWVGLVDVLVELSEDVHCRALTMQEFSRDESPSDRDRLGRVLGHLHAHYCAAVKLETLAELAAMSKSQLQRFFKKSTRMTVSNYLAQLRVGNACALLLEGRLPMAQIAEQTGFRQAGYFSRQFKASKGLTPMEFRRQYRSAG